MFENTMQLTGLWAAIAWCALVVVGWLATFAVAVQWGIVVAAAVCGVVTMTKSSKLWYARAAFYDGAFAGFYYVLGEMRRFFEFVAGAKVRFEEKDGSLAVLSGYTRMLVGRFWEKPEERTKMEAAIAVVSGSVSRAFGTLVLFVFVAVLRYVAVRLYKIGFYSNMWREVLRMSGRSADVVDQVRVYELCQTGCEGCVYREWTRDLFGVALPVAAEEELKVCFTQSADETHRNAKHLWAMHGDALVKLYVVRYAMSFETVVPGEVSAAQQSKTSNDAMLRALEKFSWFTRVKETYKDGYVSAKAGGTIFEALVHVAAKYSDTLVTDTTLRAGVLRALSME